MKPQQIITLKTLLRTVLVFVALLAISSTLIVFGARHDASTVAKNLKAGVLTADEVNVAFEQWAVDSFRAASKNQTSFVRATF